MIVDIEMKKEEIRVGSEAIQVNSKHESLRLTVRHHLTSLSTVLSTAALRSCSSQENGPKTWSNGRVYENFFLYVAELLFRVRCIMYTIDIFKGDCACRLAAGL